MIPVRESSTDCLVVGGGALGLLLADALQQSPRVGRQGVRVSVQTRTSLPSKIIREEALTGQRRPLRISAYSGSPSGWLAHANLSETSHLSLFLCVPPEVVEQVFAEWLSALKAYNSQMNVQFVFCNNGLLSTKTKTLIAQAPEHWWFIRAIFFVGAVRMLSQTHCLVRWTGGHRVVWGNLRSANTHNTAGLPLWLDVVDAAERTSAVDFLSWLEIDEPLKAEREKFFTNFMLAAIIGPELAQNKTLFEKTTEEFRLQCAEQFEILWSGFAVNRKSLLENLISTATATAENYNSLSLQAVQGKADTMNYFLKTLELEIQQSAQASQLSSLSAWMKSLKSQWGVTA